MIYFISAILGVFTGQIFKFNFYIMMFLILILFIAFIYISDRKLKVCFFAMFIFFSSALNTFLNSKIIYSNSEYIEDIFTVSSISGNKYILKNKSNKEKFSTYMKEKYEYGDVLKVKGNVFIFERQMNDCGIDMYRSKKSKGISYRLKVVSSKKVSGPSFVKNIQKRFIYHTENVLSKYLKKGNRDLMLSVILANKDYMDYETKDVFSNTGISHILALSGLHIMIIISFFDIALGFINISKTNRRVLSLAIVGVYICFVGAPPGAIRSFIMAICLYMSFIFKFKYDSFNALFISAAVNIFINPYCIYSMSFILSYISVLSILIFYNRINNYLPDNFIIESFALTFSVGILLFPISEYVFYSFSILGFISNLLLVPIYSLSLILSFVMLILSFTGFIIAPFLNLILSFADNIISFINKFSFMNISFKVFTLNYLVIYYVIIFIILKRRELRWLFGFKDFIYVYSIAAMCLIVISSFCIRDVMNISFLYVDQGDCSLIQYKNKNYLIDTGGSYLKNYSPGRIYTLNYLRKHGIYTIDALFISHFDSDHIDGIYDIYDYTDIKGIYVSYVDENDILKDLIEKDYDIYRLKKDDVFRFSDNASMSVLTDANMFTEDNDKSLVLGLNYNGFSVLFTGDISSYAEESIDGKYNLLKVSHHGSKYSTGDDFLKRIDPDFAVISCGIDNSYSHPSSDVICKLENNGIRTFITSFDGEVNCSIGKKLTMSSFLKRNKNYGFYLFTILSVFIIYLLIYRTRYLWITKIFTEKF